MSRVELGTLGEGVPVELGITVDVGPLDEEAQVVVEQIGKKSRFLAAKGRLGICCGFED